MRTSTTRRAWIGGVATATLAPSLAPRLARADTPTTTVLEAQADATIFAEQSGGTGYDNVADGQGGSLWTSIIAAGVVRRALLRFDLAAVPFGAEILQVQLEAFMVRVREPQALALHRVTAAWSEGPANGGDAGVGAPAQAGDCTWSHRRWPDQPWASRGGDYLLSASGSTEVGGWPAPVVWTTTPALVDDVQRWVDDPGSNHGWLMIGTESGTQNASRLASRHHPSPSARPRLRLTWRLPAPDAQVPLPGWAVALLGGAVAAALLRKR